MAEDYSDRRQHPRVSYERAIYAEVVRPGSRSEAENTIIRCETLDISVAGLRIWVPEMVPQGSKLNIAVPMDEFKDGLELVGNVMWTRETDDKQGYWIGLELEDTNREDMGKWFKAVQYLRTANPA